MRGIALRRVVAALAIAAIILLLGSILNPVHTSEHNYSRYGCLSNLKMSALALVMYQSDHDDRFPASSRSFSRQQILTGM